jgi:hypothetical protein
MTLLINSAHACGQTFVKGTIKPYLNLNVCEGPLEPLPRSPDFT